MKAIITIEVEDNNAPLLRHSVSIVAAREHLENPDAWQAVLGSLGSDIANAITALNRKSEPGCG